MKQIITIEGCPYEDRESFLNFIHAPDMASAIDEALSLIRARLKWGEKVSEAEAKNLEEIRQALWIELK